MPEGPFEVLRNTISSEPSRTPSPIMSSTGFTSGSGWSDDDDELEWRQEEGRGRGRATKAGIVSIWPCIGFRVIISD